MLKGKTSGPSPLFPAKILGHDSCRRYLGARVPIYFCNRPGEPGDGPRHKYGGDNDPAPATVWRTMPMKLWLDDVRPVPDGWTWAKHVEEAVSLMESADVEEASLDHDLGEGFEEGHRLVLWMVEHDSWPSEALSVHSSNPPGAERMCAIIERYGPYRRVPGTRRFVRQT
jgi:hypothetical protein